MLITCEFCGKQIERFKKDVIKAKHHFCSKECHFKSKLNKYDIGEKTVTIYAKNKEKQYKIMVDKDVYFNKIQPLGVVICITKETKYKKPYPYYQDKETRKKIKLHRFIMNAKGNQIIDHINGDVLDNRICNLRLSNSIENLQNTNAQKNSSTGIKGVYWSKKRNKWNGMVQVNGKRKNLGYFNDFEECWRAVEQYRYDAMNEYYLSKFL